MLIRTLKPVLERELALEKFSARGVSGLVRRCISGKLIGAAEIYIPYRLYKITVRDRIMSAVRFLAVDAACGIFDPIEIGNAPFDYHLIETRNFLPSEVAETDTQAIVLSKARTVLFSAGLFRLREPEISVELVENDFHIGYWAGFYGSKKNMNIMVVDAMTRTIAGGKVTECVKKWLNN
jgi:hypothetical protein